MAFEGLQDQLKEKWAELSASVQESPAFNNLREQFESQTPLVQKAIVIGGSLFAVFMAIYLLPDSYISSSSAYMEQYEENRELIKGLLKASRSVKAQSTPRSDEHSRNPRTRRWHFEIQSPSARPNRRFSRYPADNRPRHDPSRRNSKRRGFPTEKNQREPNCFGHECRSEHG